MRYMSPAWPTFQVITRWNQRDSCSLVPWQISDLRLASLLVALDKPRFWKMVGYKHLAAFLVLNIEVVA